MAINPGTTVLTSRQFSLNLNDLARGLVMAFLGAFIASAWDVLSAWLKTDSFDFDWKALKIALKAGIGSGVAYLIKNFFTSPEIVIKNPPAQSLDQVKSGEATVNVTSKPPVSAKVEEEN